MNETFRRRVFTPVVMPLGVLGALLLFAYSLSRLLLAVPEAISILVAAVVVGYVFALALYTSTNRNITPAALVAALLLGMIGVAGAGFAAAQAGMRELHEEEAVAEGEAADAEGGGEAAAIPEGALVWTSDNELVFHDAPETAAAGEHTIAITNEGTIPHNVSFDEIQGGDPIVEATDGVDVATVTFEPGTYTYFCSVPGHRAAGMEGTLTVS